MNNSELIDKAQAVCKCLSYDEDTNAGNPKQVIAELCHRLGQRTVTIGKNKEGYYWQSLYGEFRYFTLKETILYRLFAVMPTGKELLKPARINHDQ